MKTLWCIVLRAVVASAFIALALPAPSLLAADDAPTVAKPEVKDPVTVTDNGETWTMDNGIVKAIINKRNSHITSMIYHGVEIMGPGGIWEQTPSGQVTHSMTIDPATNGGAAGEVDMKGVNGRMDIEVRYAMERGVSGFYTYAQFFHTQANYPAAGEGESRFILQMNPDLQLALGRRRPQHAHVQQPGPARGRRRSRQGTANPQHRIYKNSVEHKYSYCGVMYKLPAYGWSSIKDHVGVWFINPSTEYIGGGAEKLDLVCHMGATLLDYWTSGHYAGGAGCNIPAGENWSKTIGPIFVYCNALADPKVPTQAELDTLAATAGNPTVPAAWRDNAMALWHDALAQAPKEQAQWPYDWVNGVDYPHKEERGNVTGQLVLNDPQAATKKLPHLTVGLAHPDYTGTGSAFAREVG